MLPHEAPAARGALCGAVGALLDGWGHVTDECGGDDDGGDDWSVADVLTAIGAPLTREELGQLLA
eukprot:3531781-Prymnesium_polylepis.1